jgi:hypothetical protein
MSLPIASLVDSAARLVAVRLVRDAGKAHETRPSQIQDRRNDLTFRLPELNGLTGIKTGRVSDPFTPERAGLSRRLCTPRPLLVQLHVHGMASRNRRSEPERTGARRSALALAPAAYPPVHHAASPMASRKITSRAASLSLLRRWRNRTGPHRLGAGKCRADGLTWIAQASRRYPPVTCIVVPHPHRRMGLVASELSVGSVRPSV